MSLSLTLALAAGEVILFLLCYWQDRKPVNPGKPRLLPYRLMMMFLMVMFLATMAHVISLLTGQPIKGRTGKFGN